MDLRLDKPAPDRQGTPFKSARFPRAATNGGGALARSEDGERCAVSGRECEFPFGPLLAICRVMKPLRPSKALRILKVIEPEEGEKKETGLRVEASRNFWEGSGLKIDSSSTDVVWGHGGESFD
jgi:hypothetical protein